MSVTVIMPVRNEQAFIERSLGAVLAQDYPAEALQIIVADGQSDDQTLACIQTMIGSHQVNIIPNPRRSQAAGLNEALKLASGDVVVRVDGHTVIAPDYLRQCEELLDADKATVVGGNMTAVATTPMGKAIAAAVNSGVAVPAAFHFSRHEQYTDTVYMGAWKRRTLEAFGGFNEHVGVNEDYELSYRIRESGGKVLLSPDLHSSYYGRETLPALARQYWRYGWSRVQTIKCHPRSLRLRHIIAPTLVAILVITLLVSVLFVPLRGLWLVVTFCYLASIAVASVSVSRRSKVRPDYVFMAIVTIHIMWGLGFWKGCLSP